VLAEWAIPDRSSKVLEPSAGDGQLVVAASRHVASPGSILAVELLAEEASKIEARGLPNTTVVNADFFSWFRDMGKPNAFDTVIGNPPFIRYQHFREEHRTIAFEMMREEGLHPSRLTNAWLPFVAVSTQALRPGGRLALVLPAELLQVTYASELREYLVRKYSHLSVVTFRELVFDGILQEVVLLLGIRQDSSAKMSFVELGSLRDLDIRRITGNPQVEVDLHHAREKWTQYYLSPKELDLIRELESADVFCPLGQYADIDVGIVTGRNEFFVLSRDEAMGLGVLGWCKELVGRSSQIPGLVLRREDWQLLESANSKCYLMQLGPTERDNLPPNALEYVEAGEREGYHEGYKCRIRHPRWWNVPSVWEPDAFLLRQIYDGPRIIANRASAVSTDTIHRVRTKDGVDAEWLASASMNSLTWAFAEIRGRSYGGGVLELEPTEAEGLPFPKQKPLDTPLDELDQQVRGARVETILSEVDRQLLVPAGISNRDIEMLRGIWKKLYQRRMSRRRR
jgi:adenine-specific DNA methylase